MSIPAEQSPCWARLANGAIPGFQTSHIALKFLIKRLQDGAVPAESKARELHAFFVKYERLLATEISYLQ